MILFGGLLKQNFGKKISYGCYNLSSKSTEFGKCALRIYISHKFDRLCYIRFRYKITESLQIICFLLRGAGVIYFHYFFLDKLQNLLLRKNGGIIFGMVFAISVHIMPPKPKISVKYFPKNEIQDYETLSCFMKDLLQKSFQIRRSLFI